MQVESRARPKARERKSRHDRECVRLRSLLARRRQRLWQRDEKLGSRNEQGYAAARACALTLLAVLQRHLGSLDGVKSGVAVNGYVNAVAGFADSPKVINGASDLLVEVLGDAGRHVRAAIGVSALPRNALVEVQMTVEIEP
jgi:enamine deaminase RidA (YjgF/YER057c/UK114 family)